MASLLNVNAQESGGKSLKTPGYISMRHSGNDTLQYLINNFENQEAKYIGQPIATIFRDLEIEIEGQLFLRSGNKEYIDGFMLRFFDVDGFFALSDQEQIEFYNNMENLQIYIKTVEPLKMSDYETFIRQNDVKWSDSMENFYSTSSYIVKSVKVVGHASR